MATETKQIIKEHEKRIEKMESELINMRSVFSTIEILSDKEAMRDIKQSEKNRKAGKIKDFKSLEF